ncbi:hypothetical protein Gotur_000400 [Gossypium turneri]
MNTDRVITFIKAYKAESTSIVKEIATSAGLYNRMWSPPRANTIKCNFDAAYNNYLLKLVMGIMFRDSEGLILALCTYYNPFIIDATTTEAKACLQAVTVAEAPSSDANQATHEMVEKGKKWPDQRVWIEEAPHRDLSRTILVYIDKRWNDGGRREVLIARQVKLLGFLRFLE